jgi:peptidoglycan/xylan/chitin deacetylase (PgdA/CDA1 family)
VSILRVAAKSAFSTIDALRSDFPGPRILIYHQIGAGHGRQMDVDPGTFLRHLDWIEASGGRVRTLPDALRDSNDRDAHRIYVLTFDDGYHDMYVNAFPFLRDRDLPFTLYLTTEPVDSRRGLAPDRESTPLTWRQIEDMLGSGLMTLGAHTHTHPDLRGLPEARVRDELETSDRLIEQHTGVGPEHFAYPFGHWSPVADVVIRERYATAVLGGGGPVRADTDLHRVHRIPVQLSDGTIFFRQKMRHGQRTEEWARRQVARFRGRRG